MNDLDLLWELAQETPLPDPAELGTARSQLVAAITVDPEAGRSTRGDCPPVQRHDRRSYRRRRMALIAVVAAAASAVVASLLVTVGGTPVSNARPRVDAAAARVLHRAALAALQMQAGAPRADQFIYTKIENGNGSLYQSWLSANGTRTGLIRAAGGGPGPIYVPGCRGGRQLRVQAPAVDDFGKTVDELLSQAYLSSGQRAAVYDLMAQTPGFTLVPHAAHGIGRPGVGIAWPGPGGVGKTMIIFNPKTYAELGVTTWDAAGEKGTGALLKLAIVNKAGQLP